MKAYIFVETGEVRQPKISEWVVAHGSPYNVGYGMWLESLPILRRIEVELPTKAEVRNAAEDNTGEGGSPTQYVGFMDGVDWLATRLGITIE